jgi:hypothetical protein
VLVGLFLRTFAIGAVTIFANTQLDSFAGLSQQQERVPHKPNFFAGKPRVNIMLLGSDAGEDRTGYARTR